MKKLIIVVCAVLSCFLLAGCSNFDNSRCMETVVKAYPEALTVSALPDRNYRFIVVTQLEVRYVSVAGKYDEISSDVLILRLPRKQI